MAGPGPAGLASAIATAHESAWTAGRPRRMPAGGVSGQSGYRRCQFGHRVVELAWAQVTVAQDGAADLPGPRGPHLAARGRPAGDRDPGDHEKGLRVTFRVPRAGLLVVAHL